MPAFYPEKIIEILESRCPPEKVHTLIFWSKNPQNLLTHPYLSSMLKYYSQIFIHFTITGMGGSDIEPGIPDTDSMLALIPDLVKLTGDPARIRLRFDPVVHFKRPDEPLFTNLNLFPQIAQFALSAGITKVVTSWMTGYPKVLKRLTKLGIECLPVSAETKREEWEWMRDTADRIGVDLTVCCDPELPVSSCINGSELMMIHPDSEPVSMEKAGGQRLRCGCTKSWDIGWYYNCPGGCAYCYGMPQRVDTVS